MMSRMLLHDTHHRSIRWWSLLDIGCLMTLAWGARGPGLNSRSSPFSREPSPASLAQVPPASCSHEANRRWARGSQEAARRQPADSQATKGRRVQAGGSPERQRPAARKQRGGSKEAAWQPAASLVAASKGSRGSKEALEGKAARIGGTKEAPEGSKEAGRRTQPEGSLGRQRRWM